MLLLRFLDSMLLTQHVARLITFMSLSSTPHGVFSFGIQESNRLGYILSRLDFLVGSRSTHHSNGMGSSPAFIHIASGLFV